MRKTMMNRIVTWVLIISMLMGLIPSGLSLRAKADGASTIATDDATGSTKWDYSIEFQKKSDQGDYLNDYFSASDYKAMGETPYGPKEPGELCSGTANGLGYYADIWSSAVHVGGSSNPGAGYLRPVRYNNSDKTNKFVHMLTYDVKTYTDFYTEYTFIPGWSEWGLAFGAGNGVFPINWDGDSSNDTGVALFYKNNGYMYIGGTIDTATAVETTGKAITQYAAATNEGDEMAYLKYADAIRVDLHDADDAYVERTVCVQVDGNQLKVWDKSLPENVVTVTLTDKYAGGYVSLITNQREHGGFKDFAICESNWEYSMDFVMNQESHSYLDKDYITYDFGAYGGESSSVRKPGDAATKTYTGLSKDTKRWVSTILFGDESTPGAGYLRPTRIDKVAHVLKYIKSEYQNFYTEYSFIPGSSEWGFAFGIQGNEVPTGSNKGQFPITWDQNASNDTGVALFYTATGELYIGGTIDKSSATEATGKVVSKYAANYAASAEELDALAYVQQAEAICVDLHDGSDTSAIKTLCVEVNDGVLKVWDRSLPQNVVTVKLTSKYQKGYVALVTNERANGGFKDFAINAYPDTVVADPLDAVAEQFDAYRLTNAANSNVLESVTLSDKWKINGDFLVTTRSSAGDVLSKVDILTYKEKAYTDFEATFTYQQSYNRIGLIVGAEKGVYPLSKSGDNYVAEGGIVFYMEAEGNPIAHGDFLNGYTTASEVKRRLTGLGLENFTDAAGSASANINNKTEHTVKVIVKDKDLYVFVDNRTEPVMYLALPDEYAGGYVSLFSAANKDFGIKDYSISETITTALPGKDTTEGVYYKNFTELHGLKELNQDFVAYTLENTGLEMVESAITDAFTIVGRGIRRNASKTGDDWNGFNILTLKNKEYKNFELEVVYGQSWQRYGVMIGGELGEFAIQGDSGNARGTLGSIFAYTEAEGYRNIKGGLTAGMTTIHSDALRRDKTKLPTFDNLGSTSTNVEKHTRHTMTIRVVGDWITMVIDGNEDSRMTARIDGYTGGYISLVTNGSATGYGYFQSLKVTELSDDAVLGAPTTPTEKAGFISLTEIDKDFDAYYLADAKESATMKEVELTENWWFNAQGALGRFSKKAGSETTNVDVLTYNKKAYKDFQLEIKAQQTYNRLGLILGTEKGEFPITYTGDEMTPNGGVMLFVEAEGVVNAMGNFTNGYTSKAELRRRLTTLDLQGYTNGEGSPSANVDQKVAHTYTIVVKDKQLYLFVDGSDRCAMYLTLPDDYAGGYVSLFSSASKDFGLDEFSISDKITKTIPKKEKVVTKNGKEVNIDFNVDIPDTKGLSAYYTLKVDETGDLEKRNIYDNWMVANGKLNKQSYNISTNDTEKVAVLTYNEQKYENFVATFEYQLTRGRLMLLFGTEMGEFPLYSKHGDKENGGVMLYAEADLGSGGGICALGDVKVATEGYRPAYREKPYAPDYYVKKENGELKAGVKYTMTVAVYNKQCSVYIDGFGLVASFELNDNYKGGYISLASTNTQQHGFTFLNIEPIEDGNAIKSIDPIKDVTVKTGTAKGKIQLPSTVTVTNAKGEKVSVPVVWNKASYDGKVVGDYKFIGTPKMTSGMKNPGMLSAQITVRVRDNVNSNSGTTKFWSFDTNSDLLDFQSFYVKDAKKGNAVASDYPSWFVRSGRVQKDQNRASSGSETAKLNILTYTGQKYKNFELEVDFTQQYSREMVMFGSKTLGQYIDYQNPRSEDNPICVFVEYEGRRNAIGNVVNTNYYNRTSSNVPNAREDYSEVDSYSGKAEGKDMTGTMRHMKLRVVGDTFTIWLEDQETVFSGTIGEGYEGGYISLVSTSSKGRFDNLKITELDEAGNVVVDDREVAAKDNLDVEYTKLDKPVEEEKPVEKTEVKTETSKVDMKKVLTIAVPSVALVAILFAVGVIAIKNKKRKQK